MKILDVKRESQFNIKLESLKTDFLSFVVRKIKEGMNSCSSSGGNGKYKQVIEGLQEQLSIQGVRELKDRIELLERKIKDSEYLVVKQKREIEMLNREIKELNRRKDPVFEECFPVQAEKLKEYKKIMELPPHRDYYPSGVKKGRFVDGAKTKVLKFRIPNSFTKGGRVEI